MEKLDVSQLNEVFEQAIYAIDGNTYEVLQLMGDVDVDEYLDEVDSLEELQASIPVIGQYQYIKVDFSPKLKEEIQSWNSDATEIVDIENWISYVPSTEEQVEQLTPEQLYELTSTYFVDLYSYTSFENPNILEGHVIVRE